MNYSTQSSKKFNKMKLYQSNDRYNVHQYNSHEEWLQGRMLGIGGSNSSSCLGLNPYLTNSQLYRIKKGIAKSEDISDKPYVKYGNAAEEHLRKLFELDFADKYEVYYQDNTILQSCELPYFLYSPDGLLVEKETGRKGILEIKTSNIVSKLMSEKWKDGRIPQNYYIQVLHGLIVTGFDFVVVKAQLKWVFPDGNVLLKTNHYHIERNEVLEDLAYIRDGVSRFWNDYFLKDIEPPLIINI